MKIASPLCLVFPLCLVLLTSLCGCSTDSGPVRATWSYVELTKEQGGIKETGDKHSLRSGGDEMYEIHGKRLEVVTVTSKKARFRLSVDSADKKEAELQSGSSEDLWLGTFGVRIHVEKIGPL